MGESGSPNVAWVTVESVRADHAPTPGSRERPGVRRVSRPRVYIYPLSSSASTPTGAVAPRPDPGMESERIPDGLPRVAERFADAEYAAAERSAAERETPRVFYDACIAYADDRVTALFGHAERAPGPTASVVTADHGDPSGERGTAGHRPTVNGGLSTAPLVATCSTPRARRTRRGGAHSCGTSDPCNSETILYP